MTMTSSTDTFITEERFRDREPSFVELDPDTPHLIVCSDERKLTDQSIENLARRYNLDPNQGYSRDFGGLTGQMHDAAVVLCAQGMPNILNAFAGKPLELSKTVKGFFTEKHSLSLPIDHSAEHNEHNGSSLDFGADGGLGCAFDALFGAIMSIEAENTEVQDEGREEYRRTVNADTTIYDKVVAGATSSFAILCNNNANFGFTRQDLQQTADKDADSKPVVAILAGNHVAVSDVVEIANYIQDSASLPSKALESNAPAFVTDMTDTTLALARVYKQQGIELDPEFLFATKILKRAAVRFALAGNQARTMATTTRGDAKQALAYILNQLSAQ
jgi:hypothetical protein